MGGVGCPRLVPLLLLASAGGGSSICRSGPPSTSTRHASLVPLSSPSHACLMGGLSTYLACNKQSRGSPCRRQTGGHLLQLSGAARLLLPDGAGAVTAGLGPTPAAKEGRHCPFQPLPRLTITERAALLLERKEGKTCTPPNPMPKMRWVLRGRIAAATAPQPT